MADSTDAEVVKVLEIVQAGHPALRQAARPLAPDEIGTPDFDALVELMRATMHAAPGVGLAAPQVGLPIQLVVIEDRPEYSRRLDDEARRVREREPVPFQVLVNPVLRVEDPTPLVFHEGCLSVAGWVAEVPRARAVRVDALDGRGQPLTIHARGWYARILQHECDHLAGTLCVDRMDARTLTTPANLEKYGPVR